MVFVRYSRLLLAPPAFLTVASTSPHLTYISTLDMSERNPPAEDELHWMTVQELWMKKDKEQCSSWKDEVQNVLIFSGLFSAIVTAFLIESHKALRPDESVQLLRQIAAQSADKDRIAQNIPTIDHVINSVNVLWFLSLVLSLTAALMGIVSLQWIRTHVRSLPGGPDALGLSHIHSRGLHQSYIPLIFTSLPVILIFGLTFFLAGLIVFLFKLGWRVAIPVTIAIGLPFAFLLTTTAHPALQQLPVVGSRDCFPSPYRSPQSYLFLQVVMRLKKWWLNDCGLERRGNTDWTDDWTSRSQIWLQQRKKDFAVETKPLHHLKHELGVEGKPFAYDTIEVLALVMKLRSAESEKERTALAKCLVEVLPIHLGCFLGSDLADLVPFLPASKCVPSGVSFPENSATREDLSAVALLHLATCKALPSPTPDIINACVLTTRLLFESPRTFDSAPGVQPLDLISELNTYSLHVHKVLIKTLTRFFTFAIDFQPESQSINRTTYTSPYTYWFLVLSAKILTKCPLSSEMQGRHAYILALITTRLEDNGKQRDYLFLTALIYASAISGHPEMCSAGVGGRFLHAVRSYQRNHRDRFEADLDHQRLRTALKVNEVAWGNDDGVVEAPGASDAA